MIDQHDQLHLTHISSKRVNKHQHDLPAPREIIRLSSLDHHHLSSHAEQLNPAPTQLITSLTRPTLSPLRPPLQRPRIRRQPARELRERAAADKCLGPDGAFVWGARRSAF